MIDGLKLTMTGAQLIAKLNERIDHHEQDARAHRTAAEKAKTVFRGEVEEVRLGGALTNSERRIEVLTLIRDHVLLDEVYRLGEYDLRFADLLPEDEWLDCGCLGRWRHASEDETTDDLRPLGTSVQTGRGS
jgi:hypothetical protein